MANIHGLGDIRRDENNPRQQRRQAAADENPMSGGIFSVCGGAAGIQDKHPREENFWDMWKFTFCPHFRPVSFTMLLILL